MFRNWISLLSGYLIRGFHPGAATECVNPTEGVEKSQKKVAVRWASDQVNPMEIHDKFFQIAQTGGYYDTARNRLPNSGEISSYQSAAAERSSATSG